MKAWILALVIVGTGSARGQTPDDAVTMLSSTSFRTRAAGVAQLNAVPVPDLPAAAPAALIGLLEREATGQVIYNETTANEDESWPEYIVDLCEAVLRLHDPRSLRGLAFLGIETSLAAQEYVASFGAAAFPALDEAWRTKETVRPDVVATWGSLLAVTGANALDATDRVTVLSHLAGAAETYPLSLAGAASRGRLVVLAPAIGQIAETTSDQIVRARLQRIAADLRAQLDGTAPAAALLQLHEWAGGVCLGATGSRHGACTALDRLLTDATKQLENANANGARGTVTAAVARVNAAETASAFSASEATTLRAALQYLLGRI